MRLPPLLPGEDVPLFIRLARMLSTAIAEGVFLPGDRLPRAGALARRYGCTAPTVREAVSRLVAEGAVRRDHRGKAVVLKPHA